MITYIAAHILIYGFCAAVLIFDPIHEPARGEDVYPKPQVITAYKVSVPRME